MTIFRDEAFKEEIMVNRGYKDRVLIQKTGFLIGSINDSRNIQRKGHERRYLSASEGERSQQSILLAPWSQTSNLQNHEKINFSCLGYKFVVFCYNNLSRLIEKPYHHHHRRNKPRIICRVGDTKPRYLPVLNLEPANMQPCEWVRWPQVQEWVQVRAPYHTQ